MPGDLLSKQRGEQMIANHGNMTSRSDRQRTERTTLFQTHTGLVTMMWLQTSQVKFICTDRYHIQCLKGLCWAKTVTVPDPGSPKFSKKDKKNPLQKHKTKLKRVVEGERVATVEKCKHNIVIINQHIHTELTCIQFTMYCMHLNYIQVHAGSHSQAEHTFTLFALLWLDVETGVHMVAFRLM